MEVLDGDHDQRLTDSDGRPCARDMVQFVAMDEILKKREHKVKIEHELLRELPGQVVEFGVSHQVYPRPGIGQKKGRSGSFHDELLKHVAPLVQDEDEKMEDAPKHKSEPPAYPVLHPTPNVSDSASTLPPAYQEATAPSAPPE